MFLFPSQRKGETNQLSKGAVIGQRHAATPQIIYTKFLRRGGVQFGINDLRRGGVPLPDDWTLTKINFLQNIDLLIESCLMFLLFVCVV